MMEYKGYIGRVEFDDEADLLHGEVISTRDEITFQGRSVDEMKRAFHESVDDYLEFCAERGEEPDKPFSGQLSTRIPPELHRQVNVAAAVAGKSLNAWVTEKLQAAVSFLTPAMPKQVDDPGVKAVITTTRRKPARGKKTTATKQASRTRGGPQSRGKKKPQPRY